MATKTSRRQDLEVHLGSKGQVVGRLHLGSGKRSAFSYDERWLRDSRFFALSPDLLPVLSVQHPQEVFFRALEDTGPDSWGERVIRRAHARLRQQDRDTPAAQKASKTCNICWGKAPHWAGPAPSRPFEIRMAVWLWENFPASLTSAT
jgi:hypothetical protein